MAIRILKTAKLDKNYPTELKEVPVAFMDGTLTNFPDLQDQVVEVRLVAGKIECEAVFLHATSYSRRALNRYVTEQIAQHGPGAFDALSATRDLEDDSCMLWDDTRPYEINPNMVPKILAGAPLTLTVDQKKLAQTNAAQDDDDDA